MMRYSTEGTDRIFAKNDWFLPFPKNMNENVGNI